MIRRTTTQTYHYNSTIIHFQALWRCQNREGSKAEGQLQQGIDGVKIGGNSSVYSATKLLEISEAIMLEQCKRRNPLHQARVSGWIYWNWKKIPHTGCSTMLKPAGYLV